MKTKGAFEYGEDSEDIIYKFVGDIPETTNSITLKIRKRKFKKIHPKTVERLLEGLLQKGKIQRFIIGRTRVWCNLRRKI